MHALNTALAFLVEPPQKLLIDALLVRACGLGHEALLVDDGPDGVAAYAQSPGDLPHTHPFVVEQENGFTLVRFDHGVALNYGAMRGCGSKSLRSADGIGHGSCGW